MRFIGDVHGKLELYSLIIEDCPNSIQVGDMGAGFVPLLKTSREHRFIRGNHDSPKVCRQSPNWIPDGRIEGDMMFVGGAWSIDWQSRIPDVSWWDDEELSYLDFNAIIDKYEQAKPSIMVTHDCPLVIAQELHSVHFEDKSVTRAAFNTMLEIHCPYLWIFGHHHVSVKGKIGNMEYIALDELDYIDIDLEG